MLEAVVNFMYGIDLRGPYCTADVESLLTMADLYLMEDLKDAVATHTVPHLDKDNVLEIHHLAEKYTARKLNEVCNDFIVTSVSLAKEVLGVDASNLSKTKKERFRIQKDMIVRCNTTSIWWLDPATGICSMEMCKGNKRVFVEAGTVGRVVRFDLGLWSVKWNSVEESHGLVSQGYSWYFENPAFKDVSVTGAISYLDILTPPINTKLFKD